MDAEHNWRLVYRTLRRLSKWLLAYYSEVHVSGQENVPRDGPVILYVHTTCCVLFSKPAETSSRICSHHNEILDIATLCKLVHCRACEC